jgi:hypothetical protein
VFAASSHITAASARSKFADSSLFGLSVTADADSPTRDKDDCRPLHAGIRSNGPRAFACEAVALSRGPRTSGPAVRTRELRARPFARVACVAKPGP